MKDYTKYDFAAIVGAEVSILLKSKIEYGGTLILVDKKNGAIFLLMNDNSLALEGRWFSMEEIKSLTAKIKVEDMSVKQLKRLTEEEKDRFDEGKDVSVVLCMKQKTMFYDEGEDALYDGRTFNNYIDCTDWGWKE